MTRARGAARRTTTPQGERSRERLLDAAAALVAECGVAGAGIEAICRRAGVARTALYWHFGSKEGLLAAVVERVGRSWIEEIQKRVYLTGDPGRRLESFLAGLRALVEEQPELLRLPLVVALERAEHSTPLREALRRVKREAERAVVQGIEDTAGVALPDLEWVAHGVITLLQGALMLRLLDPQADLDPAFREIGRVLLLSVADRLPPEARAGQRPG